MPTFALASVILVGVSTILLGLITLFTSPRHRPNQLFALLTGFISTFVVANYLVDHKQSHALIWAHLTFSLATLMAWGMVAFISNFPRRYWPRQIERLLLLMTFLMVVVTQTSAFIPSVELQPGKTTVVEGPLYILFPIYLVIILAATTIALALSLRRSVANERQRIRLVAFGLGVSAILLMGTNLIIPLLVGSDGSAIYGPLTLIPFIVATTYAIVRHQLFDVRLLVARSVTYSLVLVTLGAAYVGLAFGLTQVFLPDRTDSLAQVVFYAVLSLALALVFHPLQRQFELITDHIFFRNRYDARQVLDGISRILVSEIDIDRTLARTLDVLCRELHIEFGQLVIFNQDRVYRVGHFGPLPKKLLVAPELRRLGQGMVVADDLVSGERRHLLDDHGLRVSLGLKTSGDFVGYLLLGDKLSGDNYTKGEIELLDIIGKELAVGIANAKAVAEIRAFNLTLQDRVNHATSRLRVANRHLKELDKTKDEFISMASHQLRTPLTTIKGYLSMMSEGDAGKLNAAQREFVNYAFDASERMVNLISDLLNVSRLEAGRFLIQTKPVDIVAMVGDEVRQLQQHADNKHIALSFEPPAEPLPLIELDDNKTRQVIMNFVDNAIYYTKEGSVTVRLTRAGDMVRLEVIDTGIGVPEDAKKKLFSKFYRAENAQAIRPDGTGLGLYLARRVVADQNGTIIFKSTPGQGSTFGFELPIKSVNEKAGA